MCVSSLTWVRWTSPQLTRRSIRYSEEAGAYKNFDDHDKHDVLLLKLHWMPKASLLPKPTSKPCVPKGISAPYSFKKHLTLDTVPRSSMLTRREGKHVASEINGQPTRSYRQGGAGLVGGMITSTIHVQILSFPSESLPDVRQCQMRNSRSTDSWYALVMEIALDRQAVARRGKQLEYFTIAWNSLEGLVALVAGALAGSISLVGFGIDSFIEVTSGGVLLK
jgi:hypothetical protein